MIMKKFVCLILSFILFCSMLSVSSFASEEAGEGLGNFSDRNEYTEEVFSDVSEGQWFDPYIGKVYSLGLMEGRGKNLFAPKDFASIAETVTLAARLHHIYNGGDGVFERSAPWYQVYVDYAYENNIIKTKELNLSAKATRREFAEILYAAFPEDAFDEISIIPDNSIPDVKIGDEGAEAIYKLYKAGVLTGSDDRGTYYPDDTINRAAVATILSRMAISDMRIPLEFEEYFGPELPERPAADDAFFADACMIGNSLMDGIKYYTKLKTCTYFSKASMTVYSAFNGRDFSLGYGYNVSAMEAMSYGDYKKVYIELGINDVGRTVEAFVEAYGRIIDKVHKEHPAADIYILSITPVSREKDWGGVFTMARITALNAGLKKLAELKQCYYIDCVTPFIDETGYLPSRDTWDGVHFQIPVYAKWENVIRTHYVD